MLLTGQKVGGAQVPEDASNILQGEMNRLLDGEDETGEQHLRRTEHINSSATWFAHSGKPAGVSSTNVVKNGRGSTKT
jgi:hypothetical protein